MNMSDNSALHLEINSSKGTAYYILQVVLFTDNNFFYKFKVIFIYIIVITCMLSLLWFYLGCVFISD